MSAEPEFKPRVWNCPDSFVTSGRWGALWAGKDRGRGVAMSVLPVLALHTYVTTSKENWTRGYRLPYERIADLAGVDKGAIYPAFQRLTKAGLVKTWVPH